MPRIVFVFFDQRKETAGGSFDTLDHVAHQVGDLVDEPVSLMIDEDLIPRLDVVQIALGAQQHQAGVVTIHPQIEDGVFQLPGKFQWPELVTSGMNLFNGGRGTSL